MKGFKNYLHVDVISKRINLSLYKFTLIYFIIFLSQTASAAVITNNSNTPNLSGTVNSQTNFNIDIPAGASNLVIKIAGNTGDADLYVKFGAAPTLSVYDFRPYIGGSNETVTIITPSTGLYHIMIVGYTAYSGVTLSASYTASVGNNGGVVNVNIPPDPDGFLQFLNKSTPRNNESATAGDAYYAAVDPNNKRFTLADFKAFNNNLSDQPNAVYVNDADLGFGRRMYLTVNPKGSVSSCVENFAPLDAAGVPNVNATASEKLALAHTGDPNVVIATVCMEYSGTPGSGNSVETLTGRKYVKFFSYKAGGIRITQADLDGRGLRTQPGLCNTCHGGQGNSLVNGVYPNKGDTGAQFLPWDLDTFVYDTIAGSTRADLEPLLKQFNKGVLATYPQPQTFSFQGKQVIPKIPANAVVNGVVVNPGILESSISVSGVKDLLTELVISIDNDGQGGPGIEFPFVQTLGLEIITPSGNVISIHKGTTGIYNQSVTGIKNLYLADDAASVRANVATVGPQIINGNATGLSIGVNQGLVINTECKNGVAAPKTVDDIGCINANGVWKLRVSNYGTLSSGSQGTIDPNLTGFLYGWSLHFNGIPDRAYTPAPVELIRGWYGGINLPLASFNGQFVPEGWKAINNPNAVANPELLYLNVLGPTCRACHAQRGTMASNDIDFSTYSKFMLYAERTNSLVFDKGLMPLAKRTYENHFWNSTKPALLAQHMPVNVAGLQPGRNIANAGISRTGNLAIRINDVVTLNGNGSLFPSGFNWSVVAPNGVTVTLTGSTTATPSFQVTQVGLYQVTLDTSGNLPSTVGTTSTITVEGAVNAPGPISFIQQIIGDNSLNAPFNNSPKAMDSCTGSRCHASNFRELDRVTYVSDRPATVADQNQDYRFIRDRVDTLLPLDSLTIRKGLEKLRHGSIGFSDFNLVTPWADTGNQLNRTQYDLFLRWILEGAPR